MEANQSDPAFKAVPETPVPVVPAPLLEEGYAPEQYFISGVFACFVFSLVILFGYITFQKAPLVIFREVAVTGNQTPSPISSPELIVSSSLPKVSPAPVQEDRQQNRADQIALLDMSKWKNYSSSTMGISFKMPAQEADESERGIYISTDSGKYQMSVHVGVATTSAKTISQYFEESFGPSQQADIKTVQYFMVGSSLAGKLRMFDDTHANYYILHSGKIYNFGFYDGSGYPVIEDDVLSGIVNSIKFTR